MAKCSNLEVDVKNVYIALSIGSAIAYGLAFIEQNSRSGSLKLAVELNQAHVAFGALATLASFAITSSSRA